MSKLEEFAIDNDAIQPPTGGCPAGLGRFWWLVIGIASLVPRAAGAGPHDFVAQHSGVGGTTEAAAPRLQQFLTYAEGKLKWPPGSAHGSFFPSASDAIQYIETDKPGFGMLDPELFFELRKKEALEVLVTVHGETEALKHYSVVVADPAYKTLEDLKGKTLVSNHLQSERYLSNVVFAGKIDAAKHFKLEKTGSPLKGLKAIDRGEAAATLLDDDQLAHMKDLPFASKLKVIYTSPALPPMPFVAFGKSSKPEDRAAVKKLLLEMCSDPKGAQVCESLQIKKFSPPDKAAYDEAARRFDK
jgi:ABC-type phosphate/phosphonate transport system substrate-binding protein